MPDPQARREIAARAFMPETQVRRVYLAPRTCKPSTVARVRRAATDLGYLPPPTQETIP